MESIHFSHGYHGFYGVVQLRSNFRFKEQLLFKLGPWFAELEIPNAKRLDGVLDVAKVALTLDLAFGLLHANVPDCAQTIEKRPPVIFPDCKCCHEGDGQSQLPRGDFGAFHG